MSNKYAIVTITDKIFLKGTIALFYSILKYNPEINADLIVIQQDLNPQQKEAFSHFPNVSFLEPSMELIERIELLGSFIPSYALSPQKFFSLEVFNIRHYLQILFLDSDIICTGSIMSLFDKKDSPIYVTPDKYFYLNQQRELKTFLPCPNELRKAEKTYLKCFNSGMMLVNVSLLNNFTYEKLLKLLSPLTYADVQTGHSDQYLLNLYFQKGFKYLSIKYNYLMHAQKHITKEEEMTVDEAVLVHFVKYPKPWLSRKSNEYPDHIKWHNVFREYLSWINSKSDHILGSVDESNSLDKESFVQEMFNENWYPNMQILELGCLSKNVFNIEGKIIEIGCWEGKSTSHLANSVYPENLICNDTWLGNVEESKASGKKHVTELILESRDVHSIFLRNMDLITKGNYSVVKKDCFVWLKEFNEPIKFCHIDASHDYESVKSIIELLLPKIVKGGILCGDDFLSAHKGRIDLHGGVERAVRETLPNFSNKENLWYWVNE